MRIGFSTGSLALHDFRLGLQMATNKHFKAVELSALRENELDPLILALDSLAKELAPFEYVSFHAPSKFDKLTENDVVDRLQPVAKRGWAIVVHPDVIKDFSIWRKLGSAVCIENMDKRKKVGRTAAQLGLFFRELPEATFCFDIGHARQVDPTMQEADSLLRRFSDRLQQIHLSYVNSESGHERLNHECIDVYGRVASLISSDVPIILETPVSTDATEREVLMAKSVLQLSHMPQVGT